MVPVVARSDRHHLGRHPLRRHWIDLYQRDASLAGFANRRGRVADGRRHRRRARRSALAAAVSFQPRPGATGVALDAPVVVTTRTGRLTAVRVTTTSVPTTVAPTTPATVATGTTWWANVPLSFGTAYRVVATVAGADGVTAQSTATFRTLTPIATVNASVFPNSGLASASRSRSSSASTTTSTAPPRGRRCSATSRSRSRARSPAAGTGSATTSCTSARRRSGRPARRSRSSSDLDGWNAGNGLWGAGQAIAQFSDRRRARSRPPTSRPTR